MSLNMVIAHGKIGKIESFKSKAGVDIVNLSLAINNKIKKTNADGTSSVTTTTTEWITCSAFGKTAEILIKSCKKGDDLGIQGRLNTQSYEKDGKKQYSTKVIVDKILIFPQNKNELNTQKHEETTEFVFDESEEIPF